MQNIFGTDKGPCLFAIGEDHLLISLDAANPYAADEVREIMGKGNEVNDLLDACGLLGNNWSEIMPEQIGALSEAPIIGYDLYFGADESGLNDSALLAETMYYFPSYQIESFLEILLRDGKVKFLKIS